MKETTKEFAKMLETLLKNGAKVGDYENIEGIINKPVTFNHDSDNILEAIGVSGDDAVAVMSDITNKIANYAENEDRDGSDKYVNGLTDTQLLIVATTVVKMGDALAIYFMDKGKVSIAIEKLYKKMRRNEKVKLSTVYYCVSKIVADEL